MTQDEIIEGNKLIAEFMGAIVNKDGTVKGYSQIQIPGYGYHTSWDWLMPVANKWDRLKITGTLRQEYESRCDELDSAASLYDIKEIYTVLLDNIKW